MNTQRKEIRPELFEERLTQCSQALREIVAYVRLSALHAGPTVSARRYCHIEPNRGWGTTYYVRGVPFLDVHPKGLRDHMWFRLHGVDSPTIRAAGFDSLKQANWFKLDTMFGAVRVVPWIVRSHDARQSLKGSRS